MTAPDPTAHAWWLASRASGITAFLLVSCSVLIGLAMATKILRGRVKPPVLVTLHEHLALAGLVAIAVHAITLLRWLPDFAPQAAARPAHPSPQSRAAEVTT